MSALVEADWVVFVSAWNRLHHADAEFEDGDEQARTACGRYGWVAIPGLFTRMGAPRCKQCCRALGYPQGKGSPKNDPLCAEVLARRMATFGETG